MKQLWIIILICFFSCEKRAEIATNTEKNVVQVKTENDDVQVENTDSNYTSYEQSLLDKGFLDVTSIDGIQVELVYTTVDNFVGEILYDSLQHAFLMPHAFQKLQVAQTILQKQNPNYRIHIYDAFRPNAVQHKMWDIVKDTPKQRYVASPWKGSIHNYGLAVDCTIFDVESNQILDMGTAFDDLSLAAQYRHNDALVSEGKITAEAKKNRELLREIMTIAGFQPINSEWWHFNAMSKEETRKNYQLQ